MTYQNNIVDQPREAVDIARGINGLHSDLQATGNSEYLVVHDTHYWQRIAEVRVGPDGFRTYPTPPEKEPSDDPDASRIWVVAYRPSWASPARCYKQKGHADIDSVLADIKAIHREYRTHTGRSYSRRPDPAP